MFNINYIRNKYFLRTSSTIPFFISKRLSNLFYFVTVGRMASGILHDLMNPLTSLLISINFKDYENETKESSKELAEFIRVIQMQLQNDIKKEEFSIKELVTDACILIRHKAISNNIKIITLIEGDDYIFGNKLILLRTILNLVNNAIESYDKSPKENQKVIIKVFKKDKHLNLSIRDFGCGILEKDKEKVFNLLYTNKNNGTGLGLYVSNKNIKKEYKGKIKIESKVNKGSIFTIQIPLKTSI